MRRFISELRKQGDDNEQGGKDVETWNRHIKRERLNDEKSLRAWRRRYGQIPDESSTRGPAVADPEGPRPLAFDARTSHQ